MRHYRAMKWHDTETEAPPPKPEKDAGRER
jgi:hypothetical protein